MIPVNPLLCEILESVIQQQSEQKYIEYLDSAVFELMQKTNNIFQKNLQLWPDEKLKTYGLRVSKYGILLQVLTSIKNGSKTHDFLDIGIKAAEYLYYDIDEEFTLEWNYSDSKRKNEIIEEIILPHVLFVRFLVKHKNNL